MRKYIPTQIKMKQNSNLQSTAAFTLTVCHRTPIKTTVVANKTSYLSWTGLKLPKMTLSESKVKCYTNTL